MDGQVLKDRVLSCNSEPFETRSATFCKGMDGMCLKVVTMFSG